LTRAGRGGTRKKRTRANHNFPLPVNRKLGGKSGRCMEGTIAQEGVYVVVDQDLVDNEKSHVKFESTIRDRGLGGKGDEREKLNSG